MLSATISQFARAHAMVAVGVLAFRGQHGPLTLELVLHRGPAGFGATLTLIPEHPHKDLFVTARPLWLLEPEALLLTGDPSFDESIALRAPHQLLGLFDHVHRRAVVHAFAKGAAFIDVGRLIATLDESTAHELDQLVALGRRLCLGLDEAETCLRAITNSDPHQTVRERAGALVSRPAILAEDEPPVPNSAELRARVADPFLDVATRIAAFAWLMQDLPWAEASGLIVEVRDVLLSLQPQKPSGADHPKAALGLDWLLAEVEPRFFDEDMDPDAAAMLLVSIWGPGHDLPETLAQRLARLCERVARPVLRPCILTLLRHPSRQVRFSALFALDALELDAETLLSVLAPDHYPTLIDLAPALAETSGRGAVLLEVAFRISFRLDLPGFKRTDLISTLAKVGDPRSEPFLWDRLLDLEDATREAAIVSLGACGTLASVPRLEPFTTGVFRSREVKTLARAAIARIMDRHGSAHVGALSLSSETAGALTLTNSSDRPS